MSTSTASTLRVSLAQAAHMIRTNGTTNTFVFLGQPGIGKSAILHMLAREMPDYIPCYIDAANLDLGDIGMPVIDRDAMVTHYAPNARFGVRRGSTTPVLIMVDELGKSPRPVMNMLLPLLNEGRIGDILLPTGSIVFGTSNLTTDGVGDNFPAHMCNRVTIVDVRNPTFDEWAQWAYGAGIAPEILAFANETPTVFQRYDELREKETNPYIFNPRNGQVRTFCSPRSLARASAIIKNRVALGDALLPALAGTIGEAAARQMEALTNMSDQLPAYKDIITKPAKTRLPEGVAPYFLMAFKLAQQVEKDHVPAVLEYADRWESFEARALMMNAMAGNTAKVQTLATCREFVAACVKMGKYFG